MKLIGLDLGKNRTPFRNMTDEEEAAMKAELEISIILKDGLNSKVWQRLTIYLIHRNI